MTLLFGWYAVGVVEQEGTPYQAPGNDKAILQVWVLGRVLGIRISID